MDRTKQLSHARSKSLSSPLLRTRNYLSYSYDAGIIVYKESKGPTQSQHPHERSGSHCRPSHPVGWELLGDEGHELLAVGVVEVPHAGHLLGPLPVHLPPRRLLELLEAGAAHRQHHRAVHVNLDARVAVLRPRALHHEPVEARLVVEVPRGNGMRAVLGRRHFVRPARAPETVAVPLFLSVVHQVPLQCFVVVKEVVFAAHPGAAVGPLVGPAVVPRAGLLGPLAQADVDVDARGGLVDVCKLVRHVEVGLDLGP
mmetsp:Transcript_22239/g.54884  ORF Transcript_22239/g.54884 Transcript_22239/m.54884 type:complete len:256 (-) Transcript_22239:693-1460(-)